MIDIYSTGKFQVLAGNTVEVRVLSWAPHSRKSKNINGLSKQQYRIDRPFLFVFLGGNLLGVSDLCRNSVPLAG